MIKFFLAATLLTTTITTFAQEERLMSVSEDQAVSQELSQEEILAISEIKSLGERYSEKTIISVVGGSTTTSKVRCSGYIHAGVEICCTVSRESKDDYWCVPGTQHLQIVKH